MNEKLHPHRLAYTWTNIQGFKLLLRKVRLTQITDFTLEFRAIRLDSFFTTVLRFLENLTRTLTRLEISGMVSTGEESPGTVLALIAPAVSCSALEQLTIACPAMRLAPKESAM